MPPLSPQPHQTNVLTARSVTFAHLQTFGLQTSRRGAVVRVVAIAAPGSLLTPAPRAQKKAVKVLSLSQDKQLYQLLSSGSPSTA